MKGLLRVSLVVLAGAVVGTGAEVPLIAGKFTQIDGEGGGWFEQVIPHRSGRLYGRTDVGGLYRSDDHGDHWRFLSGDLPTIGCYFVQGVAVAAANADVVYQAVGTSYEAADSGRGIWKSSDGGASWVQVLAGVNFSGNDEQRWGGECLVVEPGNDDALWAGSRGGGLRHSSDGGHSWSDVAAATFHSPGVKICGIYIAAAAPERIWVYGDGGVWLSVDHGRSWKKVLTARRVYQMAAQAGDKMFAAGLGSRGNALWRLSSSDWALGPQRVEDLYAESYLRALASVPSKESHLASVQVLANGDLWASDLYENSCLSVDGGTSFKKVPMTLAGPLPGWLPVGVKTVDGGRNGLIQDPSLSSRLYLGGGYAPLRSDDGGATWRFIARGVDETVAWRVNFDPLDPLRVWLPLADLGCSTVNDGGKSGVSSGYIAPRFPFPDDNVMFCHRLLISKGRVIAPGGEQTTHRARIYQSTDNGATWSKLRGGGLPRGEGRELLDTVASADDPDDFLVFAGGLTGPAKGGVYRTIDGGKTFTQATGLPAGFDSGAEFYWDVCLERDASDNAVRYLFLRHRGFYKSSNRGASWAKSPAQPRDTFSLMRVDAVSGRIWVGSATDPGHSGGLDYSDDGGAHWLALQGVESVTALDAHGGRLVIIGRLKGDNTDQIYYSAANGSLWGRITRPGARFANAQAVAVDPWRPACIWISTSGRSVARFQAE